MVEVELRLTHFWRGESNGRPVTLTVLVSKVAGAFSGGVVSPIPPVPTRLHMFVLSSFSIQETRVHPSLYSACLLFLVVGVHGSVIPIWRLSDGIEITFS